MAGGYGSSFSLLQRGTPKSLVYNDIFHARNSDSTFIWNYLISLDNVTRQIREGKHLN